MELNLKEEQLGSVQFIDGETSRGEIGRLTSSNHCRCVSDTSVSRCKSPMSACSNESVLSGVFTGIYAKVLLKGKYQVEFWRERKWVAVSEDKKTGF